MTEYGILDRWLTLYGIQAYRLRASGHYYPFELDENLDLSRFTEFMSIHTEYPNAMLDHVNRIRMKLQKS